MTNKTRKSKNIMYTQQLQHLPLLTMDKLNNHIKNNLNAKKYALILHDKDINENGKLQAPHVHIMMSFENARSLHNVATLLNDLPQFIESWRGNANNGYAYLVHATKDAASKFQYDPKSVIANFDYVNELQKIAHQVANSKQQTRINFLLDALYEGSITKKELEEQLSGSQYGKFHKQIETIWAKRLRNLANLWRKQMLEQGQTIKVVWIYGLAGTGKTSLAKDYAKKVGQECYIAGSSKDIFQNYLGQHTLILDELRPGIIQYQDLLRIMDPFSIGEEIMAPSRYSDKALACDLIIVTSPFNPLEFYNSIFSQNSNRTCLEKSFHLIDSFEQLHRRVSLVIYMNNDEVLVSRYDESQRQYYPDQSTSKKNDFSSTSRVVTTVLSEEDLYNKLFE